MLTFNFMHTYFLAASLSLLGHGSDGALTPKTGSPSGSTAPCLNYDERWGTRSRGQRTRLCTDQVNGPLAPDCACKLLQQEQSSAIPQRQISSSPDVPQSPVLTSEQELCSTNTIFLPLDQSYLVQLRLSNSSNPAWHSPGPRVPAGCKQTVR